MDLAVASAEQARTVAEYFNGFHDGFIRRLALVSHDTFESRDVHVTTGLLDLEILFAHSNYGDGRPPFDQLVAARFTRVRDLRIAFTGRPTDWPITNLHLETDPAADPADGPRLRARLIQPRLVDNARWEHAEAMALSFRPRSSEKCPDWGDRIPGRALSGPDRAACRGELRGRSDLSPHAPARGRDPTSQVEPGKADG